MQYINMENIIVIKKNGEEEVYDENKVVRSLKNSGANDLIIEKILVKLHKKLHNRIETKYIFISIL